MSAQPTWEVASATLSYALGRVDVAGWWRYGELFIDFRAVIPERHASLPFAWQISHVRSGLGVLALLTDQRTAMALVEALYALDDWSVLGMAGHLPPPAIRRWLDLLPCGWCMASDLIGPFAAVEHTAEVVQ